MGKKDLEASIDYLETERIKLWEKLLYIEDLYSKNSTELERDSWQNNRKISEFRNKCEASKEEALLHLESIRAKLDELKQLNSEYKNFSGEIDVIKTDVLSWKDEIESIYNEIIERKNSIEISIAKLEEIFSQQSLYVQKINKLEEITSKGEEASSKIDAIFKSVLPRKKEIDDLYFEIIGYKESDEKTGKETKIAGLKGQLEEAYVDIERNFSELTKNFDKFTIESNNTINQFLTDWEAKYLGIYKKIESLLPNALTAGLSSAYQKKREDEIEASRILEKNFKSSIAFLVAISLIPFFVSIYFLIDNVSLEDVVLKMPRMVLSILPLYIPILWVAYSSNKKINLSKRLIEEYTHKEVLSKTFEGLSSQISNIEDSEVSSELKIKLLFNMLEVSSENPGKLISDYNKSDHPLMEALDKSIQLTNAVNKLGKIPGFSKLAKKLDERAESILEENERKANAGLGTVD